MVAVIQPWHDDMAALDQPHAAARVDAEPAQRASSTHGPAALTSADAVTARPSERCARQPPSSRRALTSATRVAISAP